MPSDTETKAFRVISRNLAALLEHNGMNAMDLARVSHVSPSGVGKLLKMQQSPALRTIEGISEAFRIEPYWFCCEHFRPDVDQELVNKMIAAFTDDNLTNSQREEIIRFATYLAT